MSAGAYVGGVVWFAAIWGASLGAAAVVQRRRLGHLRGAPAVLAYALLATLALIAAHVIPAALTVLGRGSVLATAVALLGAAMLVPRAPAGDAAAAPAAVWADRREGTLSRVLALAALAVVLVAELTAVRQSFTLPAVGIDALNFHLPDVAGWLRTGSLWQVDQFSPDLANGNYPNNGNVVLLAALLPWHADFLVRFVWLPYLALSGVGVYALARELRAPRTAAAIFGAAFVAIPAVSYDLLFNTLPDVVMTATFVTGGLFLLRHARTAARTDLVLAGLGFGCAFGTKWFGVSSVLAVLALWAAASLAARRPLRGVVRDGLTMSGLIAAAGGIWLVRNLIVSGSPLFPAKVAPFGITIFDAPRDQLREIAGRRILDYATDGHAWTAYFVPAWRHSLGLAGPVLAAGVLTAVVLAARRWGRRPDRRAATYRVLVVAVAAIVLAAVYVATPFSAFGNGRAPVFTAFNVRYAEPALLAAAALAAWVAGRVGRARPAVELAGLVAAAEGVHRGLGFTPGTVSKQALAVTLALGGAAALVVLVPPERRRWAPGAALAAVGVLAVGAAAYGYRFEHRFTDARYASGDAVLSWITQRAPAGHRIGLAGYWDARALSPVYPAFGPRLSNDVAYVGPRVKGMLRTYHRRADFLRALDADRYDLLVIGRARGGLAGAPQGRDFQRWVRAAGWRSVARSRSLALYRAPSRPRTFAAAGTR